MRWLTAVALVLGGIIAGAFALALHWPVFVAVPIGMIAGGLIHNPREVREAFLRAVREVVEYEYLAALRSFGMFVLNTVLVVAGIAIGGVGIKLYTLAALRLGLLDNTDLGDYVGLFFVSGAAMLAFLMILVGPGPHPATPVPNDQKKGIGWGGAIWGGVFAGVGFLGLLALLLIPVRVAWIVAPSVVKGVRAIPVLLRMVPTVFFRFIELVSTHERLTVMASIAVGSLIGIVQGSILACGAMSLVIGTLAIWASKLVVARHQLQA